MLYVFYVHEIYVHKELFESGSRCWSGERFFSLFLFSLLSSSPETRFDLLRATTNDHKTGFKRLASIDPAVSIDRSARWRDGDIAARAAGQQGEIANRRESDITKREAHYGMHKRQFGSHKFVSCPTSCRAANLHRETR